MRILLIGRAGQVAWELRRSLACLGEVIAVDRHSQPWSLDLGDEGSIRRVVAEVAPTLIVNAAAYTAVDRAEEDVDLARAVNGIAPGILAQAARQVGAGLIHYSTDYVFDGTADRPYIESDPKAPQSVYGATKLEGEQAIAEAGIPHLILRTAWVYGLRGQNFLLTMLRLMRERDSLSVVHDQIGTPTWSRQIAEGTALLIAQCGAHQGLFQPGERSGVYHLSCGGATSWYEFACQIRRLAQMQGLLPANSAEIHAIPGSDYPMPAQRPAYSVFSHDKLAAVFGLCLPDWQRALELCLEDNPS